MKATKDLNVCALRNIIELPALVAKLAIAIANEESR